MSDVISELRSTEWRTRLLGGSLRALAALLRRDAHVLRQSLPSVALRVTVQPVLFVFIFTYVFPRIGQAVGGPGGSDAFALLLVPGMVGSTAVMQGIPAVAIPLVGDLGFTREIEDRALAPMPESFIAVEKVLAGAAEALFAALLVFPLARFLPLTTVRLDVNWALLPVSVLIAVVLGGSLGLAVGTWVSPQQIPLIFSLVVLPMTFLGATYYSWYALDDLPWLQYVTLLNPLVYVNELLRASMAPSVPHMSWPLALLGCVVSLVVLYTIGQRALVRRLRNE